MIARYSREAMAHRFRPEARFEWMLEVEKAVALEQASRGLIPQEAALDIQKKARIDVDRILEIERTTKHDVIAFVSQVAETVGPHGRYIHYGLTSSDVLDTALALQLSSALEALLVEMRTLEGTLAQRSREHLGTLCVGRTHGIHAEPTSFGYKLLGFLSEARRARSDVESARENIRVGKLSGAVGTNSAVSRDLEEAVCQRLGLGTEAVATQVIPRDRHARVVCALAHWGGFLERLSVELRHLQRSEVGEVTEGFAQGQKGSSAMPHKKNPISAENLTGLARLLRSYVGPALENVALWHERDISHSSVERVVMPDAFILADYATSRMRELIANLEVHEHSMRRNLELLGGQVFSSQALLVLVQGGLSREDAYKIVQSCAHGLTPGQRLRDALIQHPDVASRVKPEVWSAVFSGESVRDGLVKRGSEVLQSWGYP